MKYSILIPTHPEKFNYAVQALNSFKTYVTNADIFFIFSNENDYQVFRGLTPNHFNHIIIHENGANIISIKKMFGALAIFNMGYDYVGILDSEILFVKNTDLSELKKIFDSKIIKTNTSTNGPRLIKKSAEILGYGNEIEKISKNYTEYWGFNEITIYEKNSFIEFLNWLQQLETYDTILNDSEYFECFLYTIWLLINKDFKTINLLPERKFVYGIIDHNFDDVEISNVYKSFMDANIYHEKIDEMKVRFSVDRAENKNLYHSLYWEVK